MAAYGPLFLRFGRVVSATVVVDNAAMRPAALKPTVLPARPRARVAAVLLASATLLGGCDMLGIDTPAKQAARREADGKAIGAGCRHTQRSLEDCYAANPRALKAAIFAGWREMDEYMRENKLETVAPQLPPPPPPDNTKRKKKTSATPPTEAAPTQSDKASEPNGPQPAEPPAGAAGKT